MKKTRTVGEISGALAALSMMVAILFTLVAAHQDLSRKGWHSIFIPIIGLSMLSFLSFFVCIRARMHLMGEDDKERRERNHDWLMAGIASGEPDDVHGPYIREEESHGDDK